MRSGVDQCGGRRAARGAGAGDDPVEPVEDLVEDLATVADGLDQEGSRSSRADAALEGQDSDREGLAGLAAGGVRGDVVAGVDAVVDVDGRLARVRRRGERG